MDININRTNTTHHQRFILFRTFTFIFIFSLLLSSLLVAGTGSTSSPWFMTPSSSSPVQIAEAQSTEKYQFVRKWDIHATGGGGQYAIPRAIDVDSQGNVYVALANEVPKILKYSPEGRLLLSWGSRGTNIGQFDCIGDIALDPSNERILYVTDHPCSWASSGGLTIRSSTEHRIQVFRFAERCPPTPFSLNSEIVPGVCIAFQWGGEGGGEGEFRVPNGIAISSGSSQAAYVTDIFNYRVEKFNLNGGYLTQWGGDFCWLWPQPTPGCTTENMIGGVVGAGRFGFLDGVAVDAQGNVYVGDGNNRIQKFDSNGNFISAFGSSCYVRYRVPPNPICTDPDGPNGPFEIGDGEFFFPLRMAFDSSGNIYVVDHGNDRIQKFDGNGRFITKWGSLCSVIPRVFRPSPEQSCVDPDRRIESDSIGNVRVLTDGPLQQGDGQFYRPVDIDVDSSGRVYVADYLNRRVQVFEKSSPPETTLLSHTGPDGVTPIEGGSRSTSTSIAFSFKATDRNIGGETLGFSCELRIGETGQGGAPRPCNVRLSPQISGPANGTASTSTAANRTGGVPCISTSAYSCPPSYSAATELQGTVTFNDLNFRVPTRLTFSVAAMDSTGLRDETPETFTWTVIPAPPDTRIILVNDAANQEIFRNSKNLPIIGTSSRPVAVPTSTVTFHFDAIRGTNSIIGFDCILEPDILTTGALQIPPTARSQIENMCIDYLNVDINRPPPPAGEPAFKTYDNLCGTETYRFKVAAVDAFNTRDPTPAEIVFTVPRTCSDIVASGNASSSSSAVADNTATATNRTLPGLSAGTSTEQAQEQQEQAAAGTEEEGQQGGFFGGNQENVTQQFPNMSNATTIPESGMSSGDIGSEVEPGAESGNATTPGHWWDTEALPLLQAEEGTLPPATGSSEQGPLTSNTTSPQESNMTDTNEPDVTLRGGGLVEEGGGFFWAEVILPQGKILLSSLHALSQQ